jgi:GTP pyrophosphokinase
MVKVKEDSSRLSDGSIDLEAWLAKIDVKHHYLDNELIKNACLLCQLTGVEMPTESGASCLQQGLAMAEILIDLGVDAETLASAIIYEAVQYGELTLEDVEENLGSKIAKLVKGVQRMNAISSMREMSSMASQHHQIENVRKMLLAMVDDVRGVLIKLAEKLCVLRNVQSMSDASQRVLAKEAMDIYSPLANRLGIGAVKWEMEDLSFRYLEPLKYKEIAKGLNTRRLDRDRYVCLIVDKLNKELTERGLKGFAVYGRSKHIHSINRKMLQKNLSLSQIYDATAVRVLVEEEEDCYAVLSKVHQLWDGIQSEFDDYISNPKPNGYRSLHTAVIGPEDKVFEVQIRTYRMHEEAEMGVAAHWKYKEGASFQKENHERKIEWLREVLDWHKELAENNVHMDDSLETEFFDDRVYIFTPGGDVLDLPKGSTPLDFAYHIHSDVGHRCRGSKVNGKMVQLTHQLETGERVEILTGNELRPSRDWLNPHLNYIKSSRTKAKIHRWFKQQDFDKNRDEGAAILDRELKRLEIKPQNLSSVVKHLNFKKKDDMLAALGRGDIRCTRILNRIRPQPREEDENTLKKSVIKTPLRSYEKDDVYIEGVGNLLTHMAKCCKPLPGDQIIGYITLGRGISIHRQDCANILHATEKQQTRFIEVSWGTKAVNDYKVDVIIDAYDRQGLLRDITQLLTFEKANVFSLATNINKEENTASVSVTVSVSGLDALTRLLDKLKQIANVIDAKRQI